MCACTRMCAGKNGCVSSLNWPGWGMEEWTLETWKSLCKVQRPWGIRSTDVMEKSPGISPTEQDVSVNVDPWAERRDRKKAPGGSQGGCEGAENESGPDSQAQTRGYTQPLGHPATEGFLSSSAGAFFPWHDQPREPSLPSSVRLARRMAL